MSQSKRNNIIFYTILVLVIILSIGGTIFAVKLHNKNVDKNKIINNQEEEIKPFLTFNEVSKSKTIDVFKEYPVNPIDIKVNNNTIQISGLKNKEIENKVNNKLSELNITKRDNDYVYYINFNMSNILSVSNYNENVNVNLVTGEEITLEEIFNKDTDIYSILVQSNYNTRCSWEGCYPEIDPDYEYDSQVENLVVEYLKKIKNNDYHIEISPINVRLIYSNYEADYMEYTEIPFYNFSNEITIYDRYLDNNIYEKEVTEYCNPQNCRNKLGSDSNDYYETGYYLNDKTYFNIYISNDTSTDPLYNEYLKENVKLDLKKYIKIFQEEIIKKENLNLKGNNYTNIDISLDINYHTPNDYQIIYSLTKKEFKKEDFIRYSLGFGETKPLNEKRINRLNMLMDKNDKITYLSDNPEKEIPNFETKLYEYIMKSLEDEDNNDFTNYNSCEFADDHDKCEQEKDYHNLIKEASYVIDPLYNRLLMYEIKPGIAFSESYVNVGISLDIFSDKPKEIIKDLNSEVSALNLFDQKGTHILYLYKDNCEPCKNIEIEFNKLKDLNITINKLSFNPDYQKLYSRLEIETTYNNQKITYGDFLKEYQATPTIIIIKDGKMIDGFIGYKTESEIKSIFNKYL